MEAAEMTSTDRTAAKLRRQLQLDLGRECERAFRTDQKMREIDVVAARDQSIEVITADPALQFRKAPLDLAGFAGRNGEEIVHQILWHVDAVVADTAEVRTSPVGQYRIDRQNVFPRVAVTQR